MNKSPDIAPAQPDQLVVPSLQLVGASQESYVINDGAEVEPVQGVAEPVAEVVGQGAVDEISAIDNPHDPEGDPAVESSSKPEGVTTFSYDFTPDEVAEFLISDDEPAPAPASDVFNGFAAPDPSKRVGASENISTVPTPVDDVSSGPLPFEQLDAPEVKVPASEEFSRDYAAVTAARTELAKIDIQLRGKYTNVTNRKLKKGHDVALSNYVSVYEKAGDTALKELLAEGATEEDIAFYTLSEHAVETELMKDASREAYLDQNPTEEDQQKMSKDKKFVQYWSQLSTKQKMARTVAGGAALPILIGGAGIVAGSALAGGVAGALTTRALKTVGFYKLNKETRLFKDLSTRNEQTEKLDDRVKARLLSGKFIGRKVVSKLVAKLSEFEGDAKNDIFNSQRVLSHAMDNDADGKGIAKLSALNLAASFERRVEKDQLRNKKRLGLIAVSAVAGAGVGSFIGDAVDFKSRINFSRGHSSNTVFRQDTLSTPRASVDAESVVVTTQPNAPTTLPEVAVTPESVPVVPAVEPTIADVDPVVTVPVPEVAAPTPETVPAVTVPEPDVVSTPLPSEPVLTTNPDAVIPEVIDVSPSIDTSQTQSLYIAPGGGIEDGIQDQFGFSDDQSTRAFAAMRPFMNDQPNTYMVGNDIRVASAGQLNLNPLAAEALARFIEEELEEVAA